LRPIVYWRGEGSQRTRRAWRRRARRAWAPGRLCAGGRSP